MRSLLLGAILVTSSLAVGMPVLAGSGCNDVHETFEGQATGVPDETLIGSSVDQETHELDLERENCKVVELTAELDSPAEPNETNDAELVVEWEEVALGESRSPGTNETVTLTDVPYGTYQLVVEDWSAYETPYTLTVTADLEPRQGPEGPNADDETVVIAVPDSGINPYHDEFSAETYPGSLDLSEHPSNYLEGYPEDAERLDLALDKSYDQAVDEDEWAEGPNSKLANDTLYWIPGTKIVGAYDSGESTGTSGDDPNHILDDHGHGTHSASVAAGNTVGACERCLLVPIEGLQGFEWALEQPWIDLVSNSWGRIANAGTPNGPTEANALQATSLYPGLDDPFLEDGTEAADLRGAVTRGQTVLFAAGNGNANLFLTPQTTYTSPYTGPDWTITVGAIKEVDDCNCSKDDSIIFGSGKPVDLSSYGIGNIPAADHRSTDGSAQHGGTSAATPRVAGVMGEVLLEARETLGDTTATTHDEVLAEGAPDVHGGMLEDGQLTRAELERAVKLTAQHSRSEWIGGIPPSVPTSPLPQQLLPAQWAAEGWGVVAERTGQDAIDVVHGDAPIPERPLDQRFADADEDNREALWGPAVAP